QGKTEEALGYYRAAGRTVAGLRRRLASEEISSSLYAQAAQLHADALRLAAAQGAVAVLLEISGEQRALVLQRMLATHLAPLPAEYQADHDALRRQISTLAESGAVAQNGALDAALTAYGDLLLRARHSTPVPPELDPSAPEVVFDLAQLRAQLGARY